MLVVINQIVHWCLIVMLIVQYAKFVKPAFDDFVLPSKKYADVIIPRGGDNHVAIDLIVQHIHTKLGQHDLCKIYPNVYVIQSTFQVRHETFYRPIIFNFLNSSQIGRGKCMVESLPLLCVIHVYYMLNSCYRFEVTSLTRHGELVLDEI